MALEDLNEAAIRGWYMDRLADCAQEWVAGGSIWPLVDLLGVAQANGLTREEIDRWLNAQVLRLPF